MPQARFPRPQRFLLLGGGGPAGMAWMIGYLHALQESGVQPELADTIIGTSAGATAAVTMLQPEGTAVAYHRLTASDTGSREYPDEALPPHGYGAFTSALPGIRDLSDRADLYLTAFAELAAGFPAEDVSASQALRGRTMRSRLNLPPDAPSPTWPAADLRITTLECPPGKAPARRVLTRSDGVPLSTALTASSAVPGVWPPVMIHGMPHIDAGVASGTHADLASDAEIVLVLRPVSNIQGPVARERDVLGRALVIDPDSESVGAFGDNPMAPSTRPAATRAGHRQGTAEAGRVLAHWSGHYM
jgi:NTE family protein